MVPLYATVARKKNARTLSVRRNATEVFVVARIICTLYFVSAPCRAQEARVAQLEFCYASVVVCEPTAAFELT